MKDYTPTAPIDIMRKYNGVPVILKPVKGERLVKTKGPDGKEIAAYPIHVTIDTDNLEIDQLLDLICNPREATTDGAKDRDETLVATLRAVIDGQAKPRWNNAVTYVSKTPDYKPVQYPDNAAVSKFVDNLFNPRLSRDGGLERQLTDLLKAKVVADGAFKAWFVPFCNDRGCNPSEAGTKLGVPELVEAREKKQACAAESARLTEEIHRLTTVENQEDEFDI